MVILVPVPPDSECTDAQFLALLDAYRPFGGLVRQHQAQPLCGWGELHGSVELALQSNELFAVSWRRESWLPWFQFVAPHWQPCPCVASVCGELRPVFESYALANWFIEPSCWLRECRPVDLLRGHPERVRQAARIDRFIMCG